ncbi:MAG: NTP transferase domain-containing protein [Alphaproteobacteria bacterium]|nr:NTP transferase domain-containing protein [Alphaproteobacteria bacterium]
MQVKAIILGADKGITTTDETPKIFKAICGIPIINVLIKTIENSGISDIYLVVNPQHKKKVTELISHTVFSQPAPLGTAHAALMARQALTPFNGCVMILFGDTPLITDTTIKRMIDKQASGSDVVALGFIPADSRRYGRLIMGDNGLEKIVEYKDANDMERTIRLCNSGVMCINGQYVLQLLEKVKNDNASGKYYITDIVKIAKDMGLKTDFVMGSAEELHGINSPEELEAAEELFIQYQTRNKNDY